MEEHKEHRPEGIRLQKVLAQAGVASRRQAEQLILAGRVTVNGQKIAILGTKVHDQDIVKVDGRSVLQRETFHYYLLNKPVGVITSANDPQGRKTVLDLMNKIPVRVYPVGRLDYATSGLLLLTNDGELTYRLTHPRYGVEKTYRVWIEGPIPEQALETLRCGVNLADGKTAPALLRRLKSGGGERLILLEITIHEGRNRQVRRMFEAVGYPVVKLQRVRFGPLVLEQSLRPGDYRALSAGEIHSLKAITGLAQD